METGRLKTLDSLAKIDKSSLICFAKDSNGSDNLQSSSFGLLPAQEFIDNNLIRSQLFGKSNGCRLTSIQVNWKLMD